VSQASNGQVYARLNTSKGEIVLALFPDRAPETVRNFVELYGGAPPPAVRIASIGPVTSAACRELGLRVDAEADPHDLDGLVHAVVAAAPTG
jgi:uroporphyrinogen-III synthase